MYDLIAKIFWRNFGKRFKLVTKSSPDDNHNYIVFDGCEPVELTEDEYYDILSSKEYELRPPEHEYE